MTDLIGRNKTVPPAKLQRAPAKTRPCQMITVALKTYVILQPLNYITIDPLLNRPGKQRFVLQTPAPPAHVEPLQALEALDPQRVSQCRYESTPDPAASLSSARESSNPDSSCCDTQQVRDGWMDGWMDGWKTHVYGS